MLAGGTVFGYIALIGLLRSYNFLLTLNTILLILSSIALMYLFSNRMLFFQSFLEALVAPFRTIITYIRSFFAGAELIFKGKISSHETPKDNKHNIRKALRRFFFTALVGILLIVILISLLSKADPIYATFIQTYLSEPFSRFIRSFQDRIVPSIILFLLLIPFMTYTAQAVFHPPRKLLARLHYVNEYAALMALIALVMVSFLAVQWQYIFSALGPETDLSQFGVATYSEYVRKGFWELLQVAVTIYLLVWVGLITYRNRENGKGRFLLIMQMVLLALLALFVFSIFRRVWVYQLIHGWTLIRIYGSLFLFWLLCITGILAIRHFLQKNWITAEIILTFLVFVGMSLFNAEKFIVQHHPPTVNKHVDTIYLVNMSPDGYLGWKKAYAFSTDTLRDTYGEGTIGADQRREIWYAGYITFELAKKYHALVQTYGTPEEQEEYYNAVSSYYTKQQKKIINNSISQEKKNNQERENDTLGQIENLLEEDSEEGTSMELPSYPVQQLQNLEEFEKKAEEEQYPIGEKIAIWKYNFFNSSHNYFSIDYGTIERFDDQQDILISFDVPDEKDYKRYTNTTFNRILRWNGSNARAYEQMKTEIPIEELFMLMDQYMVLKRKILFQPEEERDVDIDVSFSPPLL